MSKIFIWGSLENMSPNWHSEGGIVIIAENIEEAREIAEKDYENTDVPDTEPTEVLELKESHPPKLYTFPDAGCC